MYGKERSNNMIGDIRKFRFWCQKVLPLVYDDSLSYYEVLCKVIQYLNKIIEDVNSIPEYIDAVIMEHLSDEHLRELILEVMATIENAISANNEGSNTNSSTDYNIGRLVWVNGVLYKVIRDIDTGDTFVVGSNIAVTTVEDLIYEAIDEVKRAVSLNDDGVSPTATQSWTAGTWVWLNDVLYKTKVDIAQGTGYVVSGDNANVEQITIENEIGAFVDDVEDEATAREEADEALQTALDSEITTRAEADTTLQTAIDNEVLARTNAITAIVDRLNTANLYTLNVLEYGVKNDGVTDCSETVQELLTTYAPCALYFPCGRYLFNSKIEMPEKCQLLGDNNNESVVPMKGIDGAGGTVFLINFTDDNFIVFRSANVFKGIMFYYPAVTDDVAPTTIPYTFTWKKGLSEAIYAVKFQCLYFMNSWGCIECNTGHGDFIFNDIVGAPARYGIHLDWSGGTDIFTDIRMSYFYFTTVNTAYATFMQANCTGIWFGYLDAFHAKALYFGNLNVGVLFNPSEVYSNGFAYGSIYGLSIDGCNYGIYSNGTHPIGVLISDMMANTLIASLQTGAQTNKSYFQIMNSCYWNNAPIVLQNSAKIDLCNCEFKLNTNAVAVNITDSDTQITMTGCNFNNGVVPISNAPVDGGVNTIVAKNNSSSVYPITTQYTHGTLYNDNEWNGGTTDIGASSAVVLAGEHTLLFNQGNAITIAESGNYVYPSGSEIAIFNYGSSAGSVTVNGVAKTIPANQCVILKKYASVWYATA